MTGHGDSSLHQPNRPRPSFGEQVAVTLAILLATGAVFGGIWLLDTIAH